MSTLHTPERGLIGTVPFVNGAAYVARLRGGARVNEYHSNAAHLRFVADVLAKLVETPIAVFCALRFPNPLLCAFANTRQIFKGKRTASVFGFLNKLLGNRMVGMGLEATLFAAKGFQATFGAFRTDRLKGIAAALIPLAYAFNLCAAVLFAVAIRGKGDDPKINTQRRVNIFWRWLINGARHQEVELTCTQDKIAFTLSVVQQLALAFAAHKRDRLAVVTSNRPDRYRLLVKVERQDTVIIGDTAMRSIAPLCRAIQFVAVADFRKATNDHLRR